jgi:penicillin-insensitive murein DD-endopeptidase
MAITIGTDIRPRVTWCMATWRVALASCVIAVAAIGPARAQDKGSINVKPLPPLAHPDDPKTAAKDLFSRRPTAAAMDSRSVGFYSKGCLAGGASLPITGKTWQVMRLSRNRNWGHPTLVKYLENLSERGAKVGWRGLLVGDMSQPRGGPMPTGHASHQVGLDADIWLTPMPPREFTPAEREETSATMIVAPDRKDIDPQVWTPAHAAIVKAAAQDSLVERIFINAAIKKALCREAGTDRAWLSKIRPWWGHDYHFHVRIRCPADSHDCKPQPPVAAGDGCGKELDWWFTDAVLHPKPEPNPAPERKPMTMADLPAACRPVLMAP